MKTINAPLKKTVPTLTGRSYSSVTDLLRGENAGEALQKDVAKRTTQNRISTLLATVRAQAGMTQQELAIEMGCTQGRVSKIERMADRDITIGVIQDYARATMNRITLFCGKPENHVEAVKNHAFSIKKHLKALVNIAEKHDELEPHIQGFFGEAFFNILDILTECQGSLPKGRPDFEVSLTASENKPTHKPREITPRRTHNTNTR